MARDRGPEFDKHESEDQVYYQYMARLADLYESPADLVNQFPAYAGYVNLARFLMLYDLYKQVRDLAGHIADVGTFKGASFLFFAKLIRLFEPLDTTVVHGFDWFEGMVEADYAGAKGRYVSDFNRLTALTEAQGLGGIAHIHKLDLTADLPAFFEKNDYLRFKMVFIDCGVETVIAESFRHFWPRLVNGGILVFDHYNCHVSPSESILFDRYLEGRSVKTVPFSRQPTGYVVK